MIGREFKQVASKYFSGESEAYATTLLSALLAVYGVDVLEWDGLTIQLQVKDDLGVEMPRKVYDKLMGLISALNTDMVYKSVPVFDEVVSALAGEGMGVERDIPSVDDVAWAVAELQLADPDPVSRSPDNPWSKDVAKYVRVVLDDEGMSIAPKTLGFAESKPVGKTGTDTPALYAGAWGSAQARADEVDNWVENRAVELVQQLKSLGLNLQPTE